MYPPFTARLEPASLCLLFQAVLREVGHYETKKDMRSFDPKSNVHFTQHHKQTSAGFQELTRVCTPLALEIF